MPSNKHRVPKAPGELAKDGTEMIETLQQRVNATRDWSGEAGT